jgi:TonB-dependent SusC/RagA subfamily outer membrane receptor
MSLLLRSSQVLSVLLLLGLLSAGGAYGQSGSIEGTVTDAEREQPLPGVNVVIGDLNIGASTDANGLYTIQDVPAGTHKVVAQFVGFQSQTQEVKVAAGQTVTVDFTLTAETVGLDEIVVTGAAGQAQRREVGNTVSSISVGQLEENPASVEDILSGSLPGVTLSVGEGMAGSGSQIRLRGNTSVSQSNAPLVYVDGLRIRSGGYPKNVPPVGYSGRSANVTANPINDLNPVNIERVEVVKGAAATTLYGTEAAPGVIQIFTKEGSPGSEPVWNFRVQQGYSEMQEFGPSNAPFYRVGPFIDRGHRQNYSGSVRGGAQGITYFLSGSYGDNNGVLPQDNQQKFTTRANFGFTPLESLQVDFNTYYVNDAVQNPPAGNNAQGLTLNAMRGDQNYFSDGSPETVRQVLETEMTTERDHFVIGGTANYSPLSNFTNRLRVGLDRTDMELRSYRPLGFTFAEQGKMSNRNWISNVTTVDLVSNLEFNLTSELGSRLSVGGQYVNTTTNSVWGYAENFSSPGEPTLSDGALTLSFESRIQEINAGAFVQDVLSYRDRYFLTLGFRVDGNSAFGDDFGLQAYPKASLSYVISDEEFWNDDWGTLRLRGAYGHAGQAPGTFDAVRTWTSEPWGGQSAFLPENVGNPQLGPERTVETEGGFNLTTLNDRLSVEFTYYRQITNDALLPVTQVPSEGFAGSQLENVGELRNSGIELNVEGTLFESGDWGADLGASLSTNRSEVLDLGNAPPFSVSGGGWITEGEPFPAIRGRRILNPDEVAEPKFLRNANGGITFDVYGPNNPTYTISVRPRLKLPYDMTLSARAEFQGGHYMTDGASSNLVSRNNVAQCQSFYENPGQATALKRARCDEEIESGAYSSYVYPADFLKLRNVTFRAPLPFLQSSTQGTSFSLTVRNIRLWLNDDFEAFDPEMTGQEGLGQITRSITEHIPAPYTVTATIDVSL